MKLTGDQVLILWVGKPNPVKFKYSIYRRMDSHLSAWMKETFKGFGVDYYYSNDKIYFKNGKQETMFLLKWT